MVPRRSESSAQGNRPEDVGDRGIQRQASHGEVQTNLPPEQGILGVKLSPLAEVDYPQDSTDQKCQGSDAINDVGDHHRRGLLASRISFDQLPLKHQGAETDHEAEVVNVGNASVFGDVGRESDGQGHGRATEGSETLATQFN